MAIWALPVVPAPPTTTPRMPLVSLVVAITAVDGAPVSFASLLSVVPVVVSLAISNSAAFVAPRSRFPPSAPDSVGVVMVGLAASTTLPVPVVALPVGVPVMVGLDIVGLDSVALDTVGLVANTMFPVPVVALPPGVPVKEGLESEGEEIAGAVIVGLVASTIAPVPVVLLDKSEAAVGIPRLSLGKRRRARGTAPNPLVESTNPRICPEAGRVLAASWQSPAVMELIV